MMMMKMTVVIEVMIVMVMMVMKLREFDEVLIFAGAEIRREESVYGVWLMMMMIYGVYDGVVEGVYGAICGTNVADAAIVAAAASTGDAGCAIIIIATTTTNSAMMIHSS